MTIKTRLTLSAIICIGLAIFLTAFINLTAQQIREMTEKDRLAREATKGVSELQILTNDYLLYYGERAEIQWYQKHDSLTKLLVAGEDPEEKVIYDSINRRHELIRDIFTQLTASIKERQLLGTERTGLYEERENKLEGQLSIESQAMTSDAYKLQLLIQTKLDALQRRGILFVISFAIVMAAIVTTVSLWIRRSVLGTLGKLQAGIEIVGSSDLDYRLGFTTRDEIGQLARAFDHMTESLQTTTVSRDRLAEEVIERKQAEERVKHLNLVLRAIRNVNRIITRENDRDRVLKGICDNLTETRGYYNAWIALLDESGKLVAHAEAGLGEDFLPMIEQLKRGELPSCGRQALEQSEVVVTTDPASTCTHCLLSSKCTGQAGLTVRLEHDGKVYGQLTASAPAAFVTDEEIALFQDIGNDIGLALYSMEQENERKRTEEHIQALYQQEKVLRQELENEIKKRVEFSHALVHELKTPLTPVIASIDALATRLKEEPWVSLARNVERGAEKLNDRIDELLDIARGEADMLKVNLKPLKPLPLLRQIAGEMAEVASRQGQSLTVDLPASLPLIRADESRLRQILQNLLNNALKFTAGGGEITLRAGEKGAELIVEVQDTGSGIAKQMQERIFDPYYREESDRQRLSGLGLGLALCKKLVKLQGGRIWVKSEKDKGSTFSFSMPLGTTDRQIKNQAEDKP